MVDACGSWPIRLEKNFPSNGDFMGCQEALPATVPAAVTRSSNGKSCAVPTAVWVCPCMCWAIQGLRLADQSAWAPALPNPNPSWAAWINDVPPAGYEPLVPVNGSNCHYPVANEERDWEQVLGQDNPQWLRPQRKLDVSLRSLPYNTCFWLVGNVAPSPKMLNN